MNSPSALLSWMATRCRRGARSGRASFLGTARSRIRATSSAAPPVRAAQASAASCTSTSRCSISVRCAARSATWAILRPSFSRAKRYRRSAANCRTAGPIFARASERCCCCLCLCSRTRVSHDRATLSMSVAALCCRTCSGRVRCRASAPRPTLCKSRTHCSRQRWRVRARDTCSLRARTRFLASQPRQIRWTSTASISELEAHSAARRSSRRLRSSTRAHAERQARPMTSPAERFRCHCGITRRRAWQPRVMRWSVWTQPSTRCCRSSCSRVWRCPSARRWAAALRHAHWMVVAQACACSRWVFCFRAAVRTSHPRAMRCAVTAAARRLSSMHHSSRSIFSRISRARALHTRQKPLSRAPAMNSARIRRPWALNSHVRTCDWIAMAAA
mmetsp:Transcript_47901/g.80457  ORF Transcript_47901/g.80457 Transcript_47901/m.80457 type:complete len:389 (+) Transcript_47901:412-1578(+)